MKKQLLAGIIYSVAGAFTAIPAAANDVAPPPELAGFYGGVALRDGGSEAAGVNFGHIAGHFDLAWNRFAAPAAESAGARTLAFGGYRWANDLAVEAAVASVDIYALRPLSPGRKGVGLALVDGDSDLASKTWNVDVYGSWSFRPRLSLYGRMGYTQGESPAAYLPTFGSDVRRQRDGVNYGLGVRYDLSSALGLRLEYSRFGRLPGEAVNGLLPDTDQLQFGVQFRF